MTQSGVKTLYLANPYGFSGQQRAGPLRDIVRVLSGMGAEVWEPFERNNQIDVSVSTNAYRIGQADKRDVLAADGIFAVIDGEPPDAGVMVELGMAIAAGKATFLFRDDFRVCSDNDFYPVNLMAFMGLPKEGWRDWYYTRIDDIPNPDKALARWLCK